MLSRKAALDLVEDLFGKWEKERDKLDRIDQWYRWEQEDIKLPRQATQELKRLAELSKVPWLGLVVSSVAQSLYVDGYRSSLDPARGLDDEVSPPWKTWQANGMDKRQVAVHRAALAYGYSFVTVLPGEDHEGKRSVLRGVSPRKLYAVYAEPAEDDWPMYAIRVEKAPDNGYLVRLYDEEAVYYIGMDSVGSKPTYISDEIHGAGVTPIVRYTNMLDLDGRSDGEVAPFIPIAARINKTSFDRMVTQHFSSWKVRTVAGMSLPDADEEQARAKLKLRQEDLLIAQDPDTKFGVLEETSLDGFIASWRADVEALAAVSQTPTYQLTGQLINLAADAIAAARTGLTQKVFERQKSFGASHAQTLRLGAALEGHLDYANDVLSRASWQDMDIRSMSQAADALGKIATMLGVPQQALWERVPGVEKSDVEEWKQLAEQQDPINRMTDELIRQAAPPVRGQAPDAPRDA